MPVIWITEMSAGAFRAFRGFLVLSNVSLKEVVDGVLCFSAGAGVILEAAIC